MNVIIILTIMGKIIVYKESKINQKRERTIKDDLIDLVCRRTISLKLPFFLVLSSFCKKDISLFSHTSSL